MIYAFEDYEVDPQRYELRRRGTPCPLEPQGFDVLVYLLQHRDRVVTKQELLEHLWPDQFVSESTLTQRLMIVRKTLGDSGRTQRYIKTIHGRGYRFMAAVEERPEARSDEIQPEGDQDNESRWCGACGLVNRPEARFCDHCGQALTPPVTADREAPLREAVIHHFHTQLHSYTPQHLTDKILASKSAMEGERKQVTVLFADVAGFTTICEQLDPEEVHALMDGCFIRLTEAVHRYQGTINQYTGDGVMALFGAPIAHEDHPQRALLAALAIQEAMHDYGAKLSKDKGIVFRMRVGINTGLVVVGRIGDNLRMDYTAQGDTTNLAARLQQLAEPGTVLVSEAAYRLTQGYFTFAPLGRRPLRGRASTPVYRVTGRQPGRTRIDIAAEQGLTPFVGRQRELAALEALLEKTQAGYGQIVGILGEAGMGKSRLLLEFRRHLLQSHVTYLEGRCVSYGQSMLYLPLVHILRQFFALSDESDPSLAETVRHGVGQLGLDINAIAPYLIGVLTGRTDDALLQDLPPQALHQQTFAALRTLFMALSREKPLVVAVEDPHWIDQLSDAFFTLLGDSLGGLPIMLLLIHRPGYQHSWSEKSYYTQIALHLLDDADSGAVIASVLGVSEISPDLRTLISQKAEGNPFYLEELTRSCLEQGIIERDATGCHLRRSITSHDVPETIQDVIVSRLDRLPEDHKRIVQTAAVIGREFTERLLRRVVETPEHLDEGLRALTRIEFLYEKSVFPDQAFMFKHALTQDAAYASLLNTRRKALHTTIGMAMTALYQEQLSEHYEALADHFTRGEAWEQAFVYLSKAGEKARNAYANHDAIAFYTQTLAVYEKIALDLDIAQLLPIYEGRGLVSMLLSKYDEAIADFQSMREISRTSGNSQKEGESLCHLSYVHYMKMSADQLPFVEQYAQEAYQLAQQIGAEKILARSLTNLGLARQWHGELLASDRHLEASLEISRRQGYKDAMTPNLLFLGMQAYWQGQFDRAVQFNQEGVAIARDIHDGFNELLLLCDLGFSHWGAGRYTQAFQVVEEGIAKAKARGDHLNHGRLLNTLGWFHLECGAISRAQELDRESLELGRRYGPNVVAVRLTHTNKLAMAHRLLIVLGV